MDSIKLKRVYDPPAESDGTRILVERLWPRGLAKARAMVDVWARDVAPSTELRKWFSHDPERWAEFKTRYYAELAANTDAIAGIRSHLASGPATFVFASRETRLNNAVALKEYLEDRSRS